MARLPRKPKSIADDAPALPAERDSDGPDRASVAAPREAARDNEAEAIDPALEGVEGDLSRRRSLGAAAQDLYDRMARLEGAEARAKALWAERQSAQEAVGATKRGAKKKLMAAAGEDDELSRLGAEAQRLRDGLARLEGRLATKFGREEVDALMARVRTLQVFDRRVNDLKTRLDEAARAGDLATAESLQGDINLEAQRRSEMGGAIADQDDFIAALTREQEAARETVLSGDERHALEEETQASKKFGEAMGRGAQEDIAAVRDELAALPHDAGAARTADRLTADLDALMGGAQGILELEQDLKVMYGYDVRGERTPMQDVGDWLRIQFDPGLKKTLRRYEQRKNEWRAKKTQLDGLEAGAPSTDDHDAK